MDTKETLIFIEPSLIENTKPFSTEENEILDLINTKVAGNKSLDEVFDFIFEQIRKLMLCDRLDVAFIEEGFSRMVLQYVKTSYEPVYLKKGFASDIMGGSIQKVFTSGNPSIIKDMELHAEHNPQSDSARLLVKEKIRSSIVCPLSVDGRPLGMLMCRSRQPEAYSLREVTLQTAFAERLSQAAEKAHHIELLSESIQSYMEMLGFVSHELKNPLSSIVMLGKTISSGYFGNIDERPREMVDLIVTKAEYLLGLTGEYLNLARFESGDFNINPKEVDFYKDVASLSLEIIATLINEKKIQFEQKIDTISGKIICDPELMKIVLTNLLSNAVKYGNIGGKILLSITDKNERIRVSVWNEGVGFPESEKIKLFKKFSMLNVPESEQRKGHGVGLYVTWKIIQLHGGKIWADSSHGEWAEFAFEITKRMDHCLLY